MSIQFDDPRLPPRFWNKVVPEPNTGCWLWIGAARRDGYGKTWNGHERREVRAHRRAYEALVGPVPPDLQLDHLCRTRCCVNPDHLEPVTQQENLRRGMGAAAMHARQTHCTRGHPFDEKNTYIGRNGWRDCRACRARRRDRGRERLRRLGAGAAP